MSEDSAKEGEGECGQQRAEDKTGKTGNGTTGNDVTGNGTTGNELETENQHPNKEVGERRKVSGENELSSTEEDLMSHDSQVTDTAGSCDASTGRKDHLEIDMEPGAPVLEGTLILTPQRGSETDLQMEKSEEEIERRFTEPSVVGGVNLPDSAHSEQNKSSPIPIVSMLSTDCDGVHWSNRGVYASCTSSDHSPQVPPSREDPSHTVFSSLPPDLEIFSDSALDEER